MSIPDFQTIMLPLLELAGDSKEYKLAEAIELLAAHFNLTYTERRELLPSGKQARFSNPHGWKISPQKSWITSLSCAGQVSDYPSTGNSWLITQLR